MKEQKYSSRKGRIRLSRNSWNLSLVSSPSSDKPPLKFDVPSFGPLYLFKYSKPPFITNEFKNQFKAHQILRSYYGDLNKFQMSDSLFGFEERLDVLIYRSGLPRSIFQSRLWIKQGRISVNGSVIKSSSAHISYGSQLLITHPPIKTFGILAPHLFKQEISNILTLVIYKKPLNLSSLRFPLGFERDKFALIHSNL